MLFFRTIYFNNKPFILTNSAEKYLYKYPYAAGFLLLRGAFEQNYRIAKSHLKNLSSLGVMLEDSEAENLLSGVENILTPITAAGGVIRTPEQKTLMIYRRGKWDLPKGKLDTGETIAECAVREVIEETGLPNQIKVGQEICCTQHVYTHLADDVLKTTHWFEMSVSKEWPLVPQKEENIVEAKWIPKNDLPFYLRQSWKAISEVIHAVDTPDRQK